MDLSIIGYSERVKKFYLTDKSLKIHKILRTRKVEGNLFTKNIKDLLISKYIIISLNQKKTFNYIIELKKLNYKGTIIIETPSVSILKYFLYSLDKKIYVLEDLIYTHLALKVKKIVKKEGLKKMIIINRGYFVFYHFISIIYFWNYNQFPKLYKYKRSLFYLKYSDFYIKTNLKKKSNGSIFIRLLTNKGCHKFFIRNSKYMKKNNTKLYLRCLAKLNRGGLNIKDYNKMNMYILYLKIIDKLFCFLRI